MFTVAFQRHRTGEQGTICSHFLAVLFHVGLKMGSRDLRGTNRGYAIIPDKPYSNVFGDEFIES